MITDIVLGIVVVLFLLLVSVFNRFAKNRNLVKDAWGNIDVAPPSWYSTSNANYTMSNFSNSFANTISSAQSTLVSSPSTSSSGGGSSGGGFGGGGGGSW